MRAALLLGSIAAYATPPSASPVVPDGGVAAAPRGLVLRGATVVGRGRVDLYVEGGKIVGSSTGAAVVVDVAGRFLAPAFVDSHVHLSYLPVARELASNGVAAAVDLAAPIGSLSAGAGGALRVLRAGPMITALRGYPTQGWGRDGYGLEVSGPEDAAAAVSRLAAAGARVIKVAVTEPPVLDAASLAAVVARAHALGLRVAAHALMDAEAMRAARAGADLLAHTPVEPLRDETVAAWSSRAVISTLAAFGGSRSTVENLRRLRAAGATVLYGTDLGNSRTAGVDASELELLAAAGLDGAAILAAGTSTPAAYWGLADLGSLEAGRAASLMVLSGDPRATPAELARPLAVWLDGVSVAR